jgi:5'-3' exonuclease
VADIGVIDLSCIFWHYYHIGDGEEVSKVKRQTLAYCFDKKRQHDLMYVALDSPPYERNTIYPDYKGNRSEKPAALIQMLEQTKAELVEQGFKVAKCDGWEADDVIGTLVAGAGQNDEMTIYGIDKDLLQLCRFSNTRMIDAFTGEQRDSVDVLGVKPEYVIDVLALAGDSSDNIPGVKGVGKKTAPMWVERLGHIDQIIEKLWKNPQLEHNGKTIAKPSQYSALMASKEQLKTSLDLVTIRTNLKLEITEGEKVTETSEIIDTEVVEAAPEPVQDIVQHEQQAPEPVQIQPHSNFKQSLEPVGFDQLARAAKILSASQLYHKVGNAEAIAAIIMRGRELGIGATTALDSMSMVQGRPTMSAQLMLSLVMKSEKCLYFDCIESSDTIATFETKRQGSANPTRLSFTIEDAKKLGIANKDNYKKQPAVMLRWRCVAALARMVYPDLVTGVYTPEELA